MGKSFRTEQPAGRGKLKRIAGKVLLVDPREAELEPTAAALRAGGFRVVTLPRYEATVPLVGAFRPDALVLATRAHDELPVEVARRAWQLSGGTLPILFVTEDPSADLRAYYLERAMAVHVLPRPADPIELAARLHAQLRLKEAIAMSARQDAETRTPVLHDPLTGAHSKRYLLSVIALEERRCERYGGSFSLLAAEVNGLGQFKRAFGKDLAERLLVYASVVLSQTVRDADVLARVDQAAFAVLLPNTPAEQVDFLVERVRSRFELARFHVEGKPLRAEVSLGAASFPDRVGTAAQLLEAAFEDLRRGKDKRREPKVARVVV